MTEEIDPPELLHIAADPGDTTTLTLTGDLDPATAPKLQEHVDAALSATSVSRLVLDLGGLEFLDSSGLRVFVAAQQTAQNRGISFALRNASANTQRLLAITGLSEVLDG